MPAYRPPFRRSNRRSTDSDTPDSAAYASGPEPALPAARPAAAGWRIARAEAANPHWQRESRRTSASGRRAAPSPRFLQTIQYHRHLLGPDVADVLISEHAPAIDVKGFRPSAGAAPHLHPAAVVEPAFDARIAIPPHKTAPRT